MPPLIYFLYVRKSTDESDRQVLSIQAQLFELQEFAKKRGLVIARVFEESRTAKQPGRPQFNLMLSEIEAGKAQGIISWHPDRLARNSVDGGRIVYLVDTGHIRDLQFPLFTFEPTAHGKFMLNIAFSQSKYYVDNLSENVRRGFRQKLRNGIWPTCAPVGYFNDRNLRCIVPHPEFAPLVRQAFELYATGDYALHEVRTRINGLGLVSKTGRKLSVSNYQKMFRKSIYYGLMRYGGELHEGKHEPLISKQLFDQVQEVMERKSKPKTPKLKPYLYRGLFRCGECGCFITTETQKGHNYLRCTKRVRVCHQRFVREEVVSEQIDKVLARVALAPEVADKMVGALRQESAGTAKAQQDFVQRLNGEVKQCEQKIDLLLDLRLNREISETEYLPKKEALLTRKAELRGRIEQAEQDQANRFEPAIAFISRAKQATFLLTRGKEEEKRDFFKTIGSNFLVAEKTLSVELVNPWKLVADWNSASPRNNPFTSGNGQKEEWRRERDSNPR